MFGPPAHPAGHEDGGNGLSSERRPPAGIAAAGRETDAAADSDGVIPTGSGCPPLETSRTWAPRSGGRSAISAGFALPRGPHRENWMPAGGRRSEATPPQLLANSARLHFHSNWRAARAG